MKLGDFRALTSHLPDYFELKGYLPEYGVVYISNFDQEYIHLQVDHPASIYHVIPINDSVRHTESVFCHCEPVVKYTEVGKVITHNSYDCRELKIIDNEQVN